MKLLTALWQRLQSRKYWSLLLIIVISGLLSYYLWSPNLRAQWWIHDDHAIVRMLGQDRKITFSEIPSWLLTTDLGAWGESLRYCPSYWELVVLECLVWGNSPALWYLARMLIFWGALTTLWYLLQRKIGLLYSGVFALSITALSCWSDIFARLGPGEAYTVLGSALYWLGFVNYWNGIQQTTQKSRPYLNLQIIIMSLGAIVAIGSKENFVLLMLPTLFLLTYAFIIKRAHAWLILASAVIVEYALFIAIGILLALSKSGSDIYMKDVTAEGHLEMMLRRIPETVKMFHLLPILVVFLVVGLYIILFRREQQQKFINSIRTYLIFTLVCVGLYLSQIVFYHGEWPVGNRYDFPGILAIHVFFLCTVLVAVDVLKIFNTPKIATYGIIGFTVIVMYMWSPSDMRELSRMRQASIHNAERTTTFMNNIHTIMEAAKKNPGMPLIFESFDVIDYEPVFSVQIFLSTYGVSNPMYVYSRPYPEDSFNDQFARQLATNLSLLQKYGGEGFVSMRELHVQGNSCLSITFSGDSQSSCRSIRIWN